jgi:hypothetical protein
VNTFAHDDDCSLEIQATGCWAFVAGIVAQAAQTAVIASDMLSQRRLMAPLA